MFTSQYMVSIAVQYVEAQTENLTVLNSLADTKMLTGVKVLISNTLWFSYISAAAAN